MYNANAIDAQAEREGLAEAALCEMLDRDIPQTLRQIRLGQHRAAEALGLPTPPKFPKYQRAASYRAHAKIATASMQFLVYGNPASKRLTPDTFAERKRQAEKRLRRAALLVQLQRLPKRQAMDLDTAAKCSGLGVRTLERAVENGRIGERVGRSRIVRAGELRRLLAEKLNGRPVAA